MFADPAESSCFGQWFFHHRCAVGEYAVIVWPDFCRDPVGEFLQSLAQSLVIVAPQRITRDVAAFRVCKAVHRCRDIGTKIVHAHGDHPAGARPQFGWPAALAAVLFHVVEFAVQAGRQPCVQSCFGCGEIGMRDADLLKTKRQSPVLDALGEFRRVGGWS